MVLGDAVTTAAMPSEIATAVAHTPADTPIQRRIRGRFTEIPPVGGSGLESGWSDVA
jgi:hypothetical protein